VRAECKDSNIEVQVSGTWAERGKEKHCDREPYLFSNGVTVTVGSGTKVIPV
jgi:hypothetical protein